LPRTLNKNASIAILPDTAAVRGQCRSVFGQHDAIVVGPDHRTAEGGGSGAAHEHSPRLIADGDVLERAIAGAVDVYPGIAVVGCDQAVDDVIVAIGSTDAVTPVPGRDDITQAIVTDAIGGVDAVVPVPGGPDSDERRAGHVLQELEPVVPVPGDLQFTGVDLGDLEECHADAVVPGGDVPDGHPVAAPERDAGIAIPGGGHVPELGGRPATDRPERDALGPARGPEIPDRDVR
jgi:hypothetical protein